MPTDRLSRVEDILKRIEGEEEKETDRLSRVNSIVQKIEATPKVNPLTGTIPEEEGPSGFQQFLPKADPEPESSRITNKLIQEREANVLLQEELKEQKLLESQAELKKKNNPTLKRIEQIREQKTRTPVDKLLEGIALTPEEEEARLGKAKKESSIIQATLSGNEKPGALKLSLEEFKQRRKAFEEEEEKKAKQRKMLFRAGFKPESVPESLFPMDKPKELKTVMERLGDFLFSKKLTLDKDFIPLTGGVKVEGRPEEPFDPAAEQIGFKIAAEKAITEKEWLDEVAPRIVTVLNKELTDADKEPFNIDEPVDRDVFYEELNRQYEERFGEGAKTADEWFALLTVPATMWVGAIDSIGTAALVGAAENASIGIIRELGEAHQTRQLPDGADLLEISTEAGLGAAFGGVAGGIAKGVTKFQFGRAVDDAAKILTQKRGRKISHANVITLVKNRSKGHGISKEAALRQLTKAAKESVENDTPFVFKQGLADANDGGTDLWTMVDAYKIDMDSFKYGDSVGIETPNISGAAAQAEPRPLGFQINEEGGIAGAREAKLLSKAEREITAGGRVGGRAGEISDLEADIMSKQIVENSDILETILPASKHAVPWEKAKKFYTEPFDDARMQKIANQMVRNNGALRNEGYAKSVSFQTIEKEANDIDGSLAVKAIYENILLGDNASSTQAKDVRKAVLHVLQSRATAEDHMVQHVMPMAKLYNEGKVSIDEFRKAYRLNMAIVKQADDISSELGRSLNALKINTKSIASVQKKIFKEIEESIDDPLILDEVAARLGGIDIMDPFQRHKFMMGLRKATSKEKVEEIWFNSVLSGPPTQIRNIFGNTIFGGILELERLTGTAIEKGIAATGRALRVTDVQSTRSFTETWRAWGAFGAGLSEGIDAAARTMKSGVPVFQVTKQSDFTSKSGQAIGGIFGTLINVPSRGLEGMDTLFKTTHYAMEMAAGATDEAFKRGAKEGLTSGDFLAQVVRTGGNIDEATKLGMSVDDIYKQLLRAPTEGMKKRAVHRALLGTFTTPLNRGTTVGRVGLAINAVREVMPGGKYFLPFVRTPVNIAGETVVRTPFGAINTVAKYFANGQRISLREFSDDTARMLTGALIAGTMYTMTERYGIEWNGAGPPPGPERDLFLSTRLPYSLTTPEGTSISFQNLEPISGVLGIMAQLKEIHDNGAENIFTADTVLTVVKAISNSVTEKPFGRGFRNITNVVAPQSDRNIESLGRAVGQTASGFVPYSGFLRTLDRIYSEPRPFQKTSTNLFEATGQELTKLAGPVAEEVRTRVGLDIKPVEMESIFSMWGEKAIPGGILDNKYIDNILLPFRVKRADPETLRLNNKITEFRNKFPEEDINGLSKPSKSIRFAKQTWELPIKEWETYTEIVGKTRKEAFLELLNIPEYETYPAKIQLELYNNVMKNKIKETKLQMISDGLDGKTEGSITLPENLLKKFRGAPTETLNKHLEEIFYE